MTRVERPGRGIRELQDEMDARGRVTRLPLPPLRILMLSIHGLLRGREPELGRDADTGGQITYVLDLARALGRHPRVAHVDVVTRLIEGDEVCKDYRRPFEDLGPRARLVRLPFGPRRYLRKELLWPHLGQLVDRCCDYLRGQSTLPDLIHSHYGDAGWVGKELSHVLGVPLVHTSHSLGRAKLGRMLAAGRAEAALERQLSFRRRIAAEEETFEHASLVIASTHHELTNQYSRYEAFQPGRSAVIPPGVDTSRFAPAMGRPIRTLPWIDRFLSDVHKPFILALGRPAPTKNLAALVAAYGEDPELQEMANLVVVAGTREDLMQPEEPGREIFIELLLLIDRHDLYGRVAMPKHHSAEDVPDLYRLAAERGGILVNPSLAETFGLTLLEAAASGLPVVATQDGGPRDIVANCHNGLLVDPLDRRGLSATLRDALSDETRWRRWARSGLKAVERTYRWSGHVDTYLRSCDRVLLRERKRIRRRAYAGATRVAAAGLTRAELVLLTDVDETLLGDRAGLLELLEWRRSEGARIVFGVATGRTLRRALQILGEWSVPVPELLITSVGTEILYGTDLVRDKGWSLHIRHLWRREALVRALAGVPGLKLQVSENQGEFKLSYSVDAARMSSLQRLYSRLRERDLQARLVYSQDKYLDVIPLRAGKGQALRYLAYREGLSPSRFIVAGDSGNDTDMLLGDTRAIVVGNYKPELEGLRRSEQVYFARQHFARGILEGLSHYGVRGASAPPPPTA
jgi:sucrose-phosphate synthase